MNKLFASSNVPCTPSKRVTVGFMLAAAVILFLIGCLVFYAFRRDRNYEDYATGSPLEPRVNISVTNALLNDVISMICSQAGMGASYDPDLLIGAKGITIDVINAPVLDVLDSICNNQRFTYHLYDSTIILDSRNLKHVPTKK